MAPLRELLRRAAQDDTTARDELLRTVYPEVQRRVHAALSHEFRPRHRWLAAQFSTNDIVQDVFLAVVRLRPEEGARDEAALLAWIAAQVRSRILDRVRFLLAQRRDVRRGTAIEPTASGGVPHAAPDRTPSTCAALEERARLLAHVLGELDSAARELWRLRVDEEHEFGDVAAALGWPSAEAARSAFRRLQARIAVRLGRFGVSGVVDGGEG